MATPELIVIPESLLPVDGRFGSGPSKVRAEALAGFAATGETYMGTSHRQPGVKDVVRRIREGLLELFGAPAGYEVLLGNGGASAFWDAAACCLIAERSQHLVFGEFSSKFAVVAAGAPWLTKPDVRSTLEPGSYSPPVAVEGIDLYALTHNETSTGVAMPVRRVAGADAGALMAVDATSAAAGIAVDLAETDVYYFSPQKGFGSDGGLWLAIVSPAAVERIGAVTARDDRWIPMSLDLSLALTNSRADQTLNTPALATLWFLADQLDWMNDRGGMTFTCGRTAASSTILYDWAERTPYTSPFVTDPALRSPVVGTVDLDASIDALAVSAILRLNGIVDTESYRKLGRNQLRIGMFPAVEPDDVEALTACIDYVVAELG